jgi:hypothetical protein
MARMAFDVFVLQMIDNACGLVHGRREAAGAGVKRIIECVLPRTS